MTGLADWTKPGSFSAGRDPLGFQAASVRLYTLLVPGLTNVTNRLRYYSFYCWMLWQFEQSHHTTREDKWIKFIRRCEAALALCCQVGDAARAYGMAGSEWWRTAAADPATKTYDLVAATNRPGQDNQYLKAPYGNFGQFYAASMLEMGLIQGSATRVYGVTDPAGKALAVALQDEHPAACRLLSRAVAAGRISRPDCKKVSDAFHPAQLDPASREAHLLNVFLQGGRADDPTAPARRTSLRNLLTIVSDATGDFDLRRDLYVQSGKLGDASCDSRNLTRWRAYFVNEFCHIALEVWLNAIVDLSERATEPLTIDAIATALAMLAVADATTPMEGFAAANAVKTLVGEHELGTVLLGAASFKGKPLPQAIAGSTTLILSLWHRWKHAAALRDELRGETVEGRSAEGVFAFLDRNAAANARATIAALIKKFVIANHLTIAGQKLATGGRFTYRFTLDDGCVVDGEYAEYTYTQPRIANLLTFARDARLIDPDTDLITPAGENFLCAT